MVFFLNKYNVGSLKTYSSMHSTILSNLLNQLKKTAIYIDLNIVLI